MVVNLQKQVQEKDDTLRDLNVKLSRKSEECDSLMEERDTMRSKNSFALQQVGYDMLIFSNYGAMATLNRAIKETFRDHHSSLSSMIKQKRNSQLDSTMRMFHAAL